LRFALHLFSLAEILKKKRKGAQQKLFLVTRFPKCKSENFTFVCRADGLSQAYDETGDARVEKSD
jgi:hypothetical protein